MSSSRNARSGGNGGNGGNSGNSGLPARQVAWRLLTDILCHDRLLHEAQHRHAAALNALPANDRAFAEHLLRTSLRRHGQLQHVLHRFLRKPLPRKACAAHTALLLGAAQLLVMRVPPHAAIATTVELLKRQPQSRHFAALANAVLRRIAEGGAALLRDADITLNIPGWLRQRWRTAYGEEVMREMARALLREPPLDITVRNPAEIASWAERLHARILPLGLTGQPAAGGLPGTSLRIERPQGRVDTLPGYSEGAWWVQDVAAALPVRLLASAVLQDADRGDAAVPDPDAPLRGLTVADLCAAPGGKTAQLAALGARVQAVDISAARLRRLHENLQRLRLRDRVQAVQADALQWRPETPPDAILLDAPCSASGTFRRHPDVLLGKSERQLASLTALQAELLQHAASLLPRGGMLLYCVCSLLPEEGEEQIRRFLASSRGERFERLPVQTEEIGGQVRFITARGDVRTLPHQPLHASNEQGDHAPSGHDGPNGAHDPAPRGLDGFFIARLRRKA